MVDLDEFFDHKEHIKQVRQALKSVEDTIKQINCPDPHSQRLQNNLDMMLMKISHLASFAQEIFLIHQ